MGSSNKPLSLFLVIFICISQLSFSYIYANPKNYVFNLSGTMHGYGDITGPLWTLLDIKKQRPENNYIAIVDARAEEIISSMYEKKMDQISLDLGVIFYKIEEITSVPTADVAFELFYSGRKINYKNGFKSFTNLPYSDFDTITVISDTMHGTSLDEIIGPNIELYFKPPGIGNQRSGIITDPDLSKLTDLSAKKRRALTASLFKESNDFLNQVILKQTQKEIKFSFLYGAHNEVLSRDLIGQTQLFVECLNEASTECPVIIFSPNTKETLLKVYPAAEHVYEMNDLYDGLELKNKTYIISLPKISSFQFLSLMSIADLPMLIEGNSSISSAIRLDKEFLVYRSAWNKPQIQDLLHQDIESGANFYANVYDLDSFSLPRFENYFANTNRHRTAYSLSKNTAEFSTKLIAVVDLAESLKSNDGYVDYVQIANDLFKETGDEYLGHSIVYFATKIKRLSRSVLDSERQKLAHRGINFKDLERRFVHHTPNFYTKIYSFYGIDNFPTIYPYTFENIPEKKPEIPQYGKFPYANLRLSDFQKIATNVKLALSWETDIQRHALEDPEMQMLKRDRDAKHYAGFSYDIIQLENSPTMLVHGTPREDLPNCLDDFYKMIINENVRVIVALNNFNDWEKAIPYYAKSKLSEKINGWTITCTRPKILYRGKTATHIPKHLKKKFRNTPLNSDELKHYRARIEERTITAKKGNETKTITHLHYRNWPDRTVAPDIKALNILMERQEQISEEYNEPIAIHCQGGIGRTLGYVQSIWIRREIREAKKLGGPISNHCFNIPEMTYQLKRQAPRLLGSPKGERLAMVYAIGDAHSSISKKVTDTLVKYSNTPSNLSPLDHAIEMNDFDAALILLEYTKEVDQHDQAISVLTRVLENLLKQSTESTNWKISETQKNLINALIKKNACTFCGTIPASSLILAIRLNLHSLVKKILKQNKGKNFGGDPMFWAIKTSNYKIMEMLIKSGIDLNYGRQYNEYLLLAIQEEDIDVVYFLLEEGANPNSGTSSVLKTALTKKSPTKELSQKQLKIANLLIDYGAKL